MAEQEMFDYLTNTVADYVTVTLSVTPDEVLSERGAKHQVIHEFDDISIAVASINDASFFIVSLQWDALSLSDSGSILDMYHNTSKANGMENTFYWEHPTDGHIYVARFLSEIERVYISTRGVKCEISQLNLRIEGRKAEA